MRILEVSRLSRIYYEGRFYPYPLELLKTLRNLGVYESSAAFLSYLKARLTPSGGEETFEQWVTNRFGKRLYDTFFKTYTEKVWGMSCDRIEADWAAQRIRELSVRRLLTNALFGGDQGTATLIDEFLYPARGPGQMWERFAEEVDRRGGNVRLDTEVVSLRRDGQRVVAASVRETDRAVELEADSFISSAPLDFLVQALVPPPPDEVVEAAAQLRYRDFVLVGLILDLPEIFPDNWIYVHSPDVRVGRIQNFKNWSPAMLTGLLAAQKLIHGEVDADVWKVNTDRSYYESFGRE